MKVLKAVIIVIIGLALGIGTGVYRIADVENSPAFFKNGSWRGSRNLPLGEDKLLTAQVSAFALFALPSTEAIYLFARRDEHDKLLTGKSDYIIEGNVNQIKSLYWSITAYGKDLYLVPNAIDKYSFNNGTLITDSAGNFSITVSPFKHDDNWLPSPEGGRFVLVMRIYKGDKTYLENLSTASLPTIKTVKTK